jgi:hypothetical protein
MFVGALILVISVESQMAVQCVDVPVGKTVADLDARGDAWFAKGDAITIGGKRYAKSGKPIGMAPSDVTPLQGYKGAMAYAPLGGAKGGPIYVLADIRDCTFQAYRPQ